jgi:predicted alpha/beta-fold hydrolase
MRAEVVTSPGEVANAIAAQLPQLREPYVPTPWLRNAHLQLLWLMLAEAVAPRLRYDRVEVLRMRDGGTTSLHWLEDGCGPRTPTLVVLHSIAGDDQSSRTLIRELRRATGWRIVLCLRRGHGGLALTAPALNTMGCTADLREQLQRIRARYPGSPLYAVGVSAGSALLVRYLGEEGAGSMIRAGVAYCPGYDISVAWKRVHPFYSRRMTERLKQYFLKPHEATFAHLDSYRACLAARDLDEFHENLYELAGCPSPRDYLERSNPAAVFPSVAVPVMILNADDDPVCVVQNALDHVETVRQVPDAILVRTAHGSHCAFFEGWWPRSWSNRLIAQYVKAVASLQGAPAGRPSHTVPLS